MLQRVAVLAAGHRHDSESRTGGSRWGGLATSPALKIKPNSQSTIRINFGNGASGSQSNLRCDQPLHRRQPSPRQMERQLTRRVHDLDQGRRGPHIQRHIHQAPKAENISKFGGIDAGDKPG